MPSTVRLVCGAGAPGGRPAFGAAGDGAEGDDPASGEPGSDAGGAADGGKGPPVTACMPSTVRFVRGSGACEVPAAPG
ncbi:MAG: hypothetical protein AAF447_19905, partial [Myxococcota bacterium]